MTDDEEGGEEEQGPEGDKEVPEGAEEQLGGEDGAGQEEEPSSTEDRHTEL